MTQADLVALALFLKTVIPLAIGGVFLVYLPTKWPRYLRQLVIAVFALSIGVGALTARLSYSHSPGPLRSNIPSLISLGPLGIYVTGSIRTYFISRQHRGRQLYELARPANLELRWGGRLIMLMVVLQSAVVLYLGALTGWEYLDLCLSFTMTAWMGFFIANIIGRLVLLDGGIIKGGTFYKWAKLGKFEWMPANTPLLRIQVRHLSDIRIACPDDPEINRILTEHGLVRW
jgi:hypothetical protein